MARERTKWTPEMVERLIDLYNRNFTVLEIAQDLGLDFDVVKRWINNHRNAISLHPQPHMKKLESKPITPAQTEQQPEEPKYDAVNHPEHYTFGNIECIDAINAATSILTGFQAYLSGTILKYIWRWPYKSGLEDLLKARRYLDWLIEEVQKDA